jgi:threonine aldolase
MMAETKDLAADFRSDTVTKPTQPMLQAMMGAVVGDSVYGEDPTENELCAFMAEFAGKQAGLFCCTGECSCLVRTWRCFRRARFSRHKVGVQSNQIGLRVNTHRSHAIFGEVLFAKDAHLGFRYSLVQDLGHALSVPARELGGAVFNSRVQPVPVVFSGKHITAEDIRRSLCLKHDLHSTTTIGVCVENTMVETFFVLIFLCLISLQAGQVMPLEELKRISAVCKENGLFLHLDGARLWNASVATGVPIKEWASHVDSLSLCFSKGLGGEMVVLFVAARSQPSRCCSSHRQHTAGHA